MIDFLKNIHSIKFCRLLEKNCGHSKLCQKQCHEQLRKYKLYSYKMKSWEHLSIQLRLFFGLIYYIYKFITLLFDSHIQNSITMTYTNTPDIYYFPRVWMFDEMNFLLAITKSFGMFHVSKFLVHGFPFRCESVCETCRELRKEVIRLKLLYWYHYKNV